MRRSSTAISVAVSARAGSASGAERLSIVIQKTPQLRMQKSEIRLVRRWAVLSFDSSALQPDLRILWNTSIFHLKAYHSSFSMASAREPRGRSVISFQSILFLFLGVPRSSAWMTVIKQHPELKLTKVMVSEAGASVYSASAYASEELPELDVTLRGAASIARRLQDPLAELVKIDPKAIGVGQYQHDVSQTKLARSLDAVVEDCVNAVGVDVNTASPALLARISGLSATLAEAMVRYRDEHGAFANHEALRKVPRLGAKTFEQAAGFLRIMGGENPLDASAVHPEAYPVVEKILADLGKPLSELTGDARPLMELDATRYTSEQFGLST